jgi:hypothetical protein
MPISFDKFDWSGLVDTLLIKVITLFVVIPIDTVLYVVWEIVFCSSIDKNVLIWLCSVKRFAKTSRLDCGERPGTLGL